MVTTQERFSGVNFCSAWTDGSAMVTIVASSTIISWAPVSRTSASPRRGLGVLRVAGAAGGSAGTGGEAMDMVFLL
jgi:hypothetical protein